MYDEFYFFCRRIDYCSIMLLLLLLLEAKVLLDGRCMHACGFLEEDLTSCCYRIHITRTTLVLTAAACWTSSNLTKADYDHMQQLEYGRQRNNE
jgi:hypothetical protein